MDFKKQNGYKEGRPKLAVPQRGGTSPPLPQSNPKAAQTTTPANKPSRPPHQDNKNQHANKKPKTKVLSHVRSVFVTKKAVVASIAVVAIVGSLAANAVINQQNTAHKSDDGSDALVENIEYQTVLPEGRSISDLGGWKRVSPSKSAPVFAYTDTLDNISISVSQQPLPDSFKANTDDKVAELAKKFNATTRIDASGTTVYVGTSAKGPQSAILTKNGLLILMKSQQKVDDKSWTKYVKSLN